MCGIVGYIGKNKVIPILLNGLESLEYRGYDSAGIAYVTDKINIIKEKGKLENLNKIVDKDTNTYLGIGHTRWATHGKPSKNNAHPHHHGNITLVHNGIIENYEELKLILKEYKFVSETDTEVLTALIDKLYKEKKDMISVLSKCGELIRGSYALGIIVNDEHTLYATRKDSPLIIATNSDGNYIASDVPAILKYTNEYMLLDNYEIAVLKEDNVDFYNRYLEKVIKKISTFEGDYEAACKNGYDHFMLKEIYEQPNVINKTILPYIECGLNSLEKLPDLAKYKSFEIVACGSAYHAGLIGKYLIEKYDTILVNVYIASEYRYSKIFHDSSTLVIFISQSGETADSLACLRKVKEEGLATLGIVNVVDSSIAREVDNVIYTKAGCEIAVATTKAYSAQVAILALIALKLSSLKEEEMIYIIQEFKNISTLMEDLLNYDYSLIASSLYLDNDIFYIGRLIDYYLSQEGSLKLKEISYIHSEAYPAGELKHGTISLINKDTPVIAISTLTDLNEKMLSNIKEVKARGAKIIYLTTQDNDFDYKVIIPKTHDLLQPLLTIIPLQLIAYHVAKLKNCDIDKPRNLAKSVTVE